MLRSDLLNLGLLFERIGDGVFLYECGDIVKKFDEMID